MICRFRFKRESKGVFGEQTLCGEDISVVIRGRPIRPRDVNRDCVVSLLGDGGPLQCVLGVCIFGVVLAGNAGVTVVFYILRHVRPKVMSRDSFMESLAAHVRPLVATMHMDKNCGNEDMWKYQDGYIEFVVQKMVFEQ